MRHQLTLFPRDTFARFSSRWIMAHVGVERAEVPRPLFDFRARVVQQLDGRRYVYEREVCAVDAARATDRIHFLHTVPTNGRGQLERVTFA